jgi:hypothetical protein
MNIYQQYLTYGLSVIPCRDKKPLLHEWKKYQEKPATDEDAANWTGQIAIICGKVSSGVGCIDFDVKNGNQWDNWRLLINEKYPELLSKLVIEKTPSGGYHVVFKTALLIRNKKLCRNKGHTEASIETRGEGGYFVCHPSENYSLDYEDFSNIQKLTDDETDILISTAASLNEVSKETIEPQQKPEQLKTVSGLSPFDDYNQRHDVVQLLQTHKWKLLFQRNNASYFQRPGKEGRGISATWNVVPERFYVFSTSTVFENENVYKASAVYAMLEHGSDYSAAAKALYASGFGERVIASEQMLGGQREPVYWDIRDLSPQRFFDNPPVPFEFIVPGLLPKGIVGFLYGAGGSYKSLAALWLIIQRAIYEFDNKNCWMDRFPIGAGGSSIFFSAEDLDIDFHHRIHNILQKIHEMRPDISIETLQKSIVKNTLIICREQWLLDGEIYLVDVNGKPTVKMKPAIKLINDFGADLAIFETFSRIAPIEENDNRIAARVVATLEEIRDKTGVTLPCIAHSSKLGRNIKTDQTDLNGLRGGGALMDNARWGMSFRVQSRSEEGLDRLEINHTKAFRGRRIDPFNVEINYPRFSLVEVAKPKGKTMAERDNLYALFKEKNFWCFTDLAKAIMDKTGLQLRTAKQRIADARELGVLIKNNDGTYAPNISIEKNSNDWIQK